MTTANPAYRGALLCRPSRAPIIRPPTTAGTVVLSGIASERRLAGQLGMRSGRTSPPLQRVTDSDLLDGCQLTFTTGGA